MEEASKKARLLSTGASSCAHHQVTSKRPFLLTLSLYPNAESPIGYAALADERRCRFRKIYLFSDMASPGFKGSSLIPAEPGRAARPKDRSSNANGLCGQKSAGSAEILRDFQRDILSRSVDLMWGCHSQVLASLRDRHLGPPMMGSGGCGGPIYKGVLAVRLTAGIRTRNGLAPSIVLRVHRSAGRRNSRFSCFCCA
jgi:hypothetical protein